MPISTQPTPIGCVEIGMVVEGVHLMDADVVELVGRGIDGSHHGHGLSVGERNDDVGAGSEVIEHRFGRGGSGRCRRHDGRLLMWSRATDWKDRPIHG
jgi:hypothetical protein